MRINDENDQQQLQLIKLNPTVATLCGLLWIVKVVLLELMKSVAKDKN